MNASLLSDDLYLRFRTLLREHCGLFYPEQRRADLSHSLSLVRDAGGYSTLTELYNDALAGGAVWERLIAQLTVGETYFFRNAPQFAALRSQIVPDLRARKQATRAIRCWSAGCATGEEPYSLAMLLGELLPPAEAWQVSILASDINPHFLARAREGLYGEWSFRETDQWQRRQFFQAEGTRWRLNESIRRMVQFICLNLVEPGYPALLNGTTALDLILCRNVTIYFDLETTRQIVRRFYEALTPGGWLIVGHAEPQNSIYAEFEAHNLPGTVLYRKPLQAPLFPIADSTSLLMPPATVLPALREQNRLQPEAPVTQAMPHASLAHTVAEAVVPVTHEPALVTTEQARAALNQRSYEQAEQHCQTILAQQPLCLEAHYLLALAHEEQGKFDQALAAYRRTVFLDRGFVMGRVGMGRIWQQLGRPADARRAFSQVLRQLAEGRAAYWLLPADELTVADLQGYLTQQLRSLPQ